MSGPKRNFEEVDPDYVDVCTDQNKRQRALEEDAKQAVCQRIQNIIRNEFLKEINSKESELQQVDKRLSEARLMMDRLRACVVASYYGQINNSPIVQTNCANAPPPSIHTAVKKFIGKAPSHQNLTANGHPNHIQENHHQENLSTLTREDRLLGSDTSKSSQPSSLVSSLSTNSAPKTSPNSLTYDDRRSRFKIKKKIIVGNVSKYIPVDHREANDMSSHKWMVYVRGPRATPDISSFVKKVWFFLHHSYKPNDLVEISSPPFHLTRRGWGEFPVRVQLHFVDPRNKKVDIIHHLKLDKTFTGLQTPGAETVIEVELEKDFFEASDSSNTNSSLPTQVYPTFSAASLMKQASNSDIKVDDKRLNSESEINRSPDINSSRQVPQEMVLTSDVDKPDEQRLLEEYNVTIAHEDPEENIVDVCADGFNDNQDIKPLVTENQTFANPFSPNTNDNADNKKLMAIKDPFQHMPQNIKTAGSLFGPPPQETNITRTMSTSLDNPTVIHHKQVFTVFSSPVSLSVPSVTVKSSQPIVSQISQNISQTNKPIILIPSALSTCTVAKSNSQIVNASSLLGMQQKDNNPISKQKVIFLNSNSSVVARLPVQTSSVRHVAPKQVSLLAVPPKQVSLLTTPPKQVSLLTGRVVHPFTAPVHQASSTSSTHISTSLLTQKQNFSHTTGQTLVLNKATNQVLVVNNALPQTNQLTDVSRKVIYPTTSPSPYPVAVRYAVRPTKQFSLLKNFDVLPGSHCYSSELVTQDFSSAVNNQQSNLITMSSLDPSLTCPKMSALGKTKHGKNCMKADIKIEKKVPTEEERKKGQYEVLKAWKENPELYERSLKAKRIVLAAKDKIDGEAEDIPELIVDDYSSMSSLLKDAVKLHPLIQENVNKLTHPYCAHSLDQWTSWPVGKQRANEWHRACFVLKFIKKCLKNKREFKGERLATTRELVKWCRLHAFSPYGISSSFKSSNPDTYIDNNVDLPEFCSSFTPMLDLEKELSCYKINGDIQNQDLDIVNIEINQPKVKIKTEIEDTATDKTNCKSSIQCLSPSEGAEFINDELRKRCLRIEPTELEPGIYSYTVMDMLYKVMLEFGSDIIRESASILSQTQRQPDQVITRNIIHSALTHLPEAGFCCDRFLGKEEEDDVGTR